jgi:hypothetical protein
MKGKEKEGNKSWSWECEHTIKHMHCVSGHYPSPCFKNQMLFRILNSVFVFRWILLSVVRLAELVWVSGHHNQHTRYIQSKNSKHHRRDFREILRMWETPHTLSLAPMSMHYLDTIVKIGVLLEYWYTIVTKFWSHLHSIYTYDLY